MKQSTTMNEITALLHSAYQPEYALVFSANSETAYAEVYSFDARGKMINPHPLSYKDADRLKAALYELYPESDEQKQAFLRCKGLLPEQVLHFDASVDGHVIWYTPARKVSLCFGGQLELPDGEACVPPLVWKASKSNLYIYALQDDKKPGLQTPLCRAPFFNTGYDGKVCMGNVKTIFHDTYLENFMKLWEAYFFHSEFTHSIQQESPITGNLLQLWTKLVQTGEAFPTELLKPTAITLQKLMA
ncbi:hypothetical protein [Chitinophaga pinensis]|uniref:PRTRC system protein B n=1 Tax=Chitinophaga pinensis (strain ATCC 43595 / DSM 2588 / LMG 13176 / NBRC 15968 / NCIMB 11800 / UQM 2034) TaxID=485918 RepID=A0A979G4R6_CHIPD|nr:hypothetical protein [Chitinophaga pinensis]ACU60700.1 hypothetical protein Cpin_3233 [Chitinophaga pinensis DSM 2588]